MSAPYTTRFSLAMPINSSASIVAATQIVLFMLRAIGRVELDFFQREQQSIVEFQPYRLNGTLSAAANAPIAPGDSEEVARLERMIRGQVERRYARHGIPDV